MLVNEVGLGVVIMSMFVVSEMVNSIMLEMLVLVLSSI